MKYGLREDVEAFTKKEEYLWKNYIENEIKSLKNEVAQGKKQLAKVSSKIKFLAPNIQARPTYKLKEKDEWHLPTGGTRSFKFNAKQTEEDLSIRSSWSPEEFRLVDNVIAKTPQNNQNVNAGKFKWHPPTGGTSFFKFSAKQTEEDLSIHSSWSPEELRLADYVLAQTAGNYQNVNAGPTQPLFSFTSLGTGSPNMNKDQQHFNSWPVIPDFSSASASLDRTELVSKVEEYRAAGFKYEELLDKVVSELKVMNKNITSVDSRLFAVETLLSELSVQVSVIDSKLQSVDMVVAMGNWETKWLALKPLLVSLENTPVKSDVKTADGEIETNQSFELNEIDTSISAVSSMNRSSVLPEEENEEFTSVKYLKFCHPSSHLDSPLTPLNVGDSSKDSFDCQNEIDTLGSAQSTPGLILSKNMEDSIESSSKSCECQNKIGISVSTQITPTSFSQNARELSTLTSSVRTSYCEDLVTPTIKSNSLKLEKQTIKCTEIDSLTDDIKQKYKDTSDTSSTVSSSIKTEINDPEESSNNNTGCLEDSLTLSVTNFYSDLFYRSGKVKTESCSDFDHSNESKVSSTLNISNNLENVQNSSEKTDCTTTTPSDDALSKKESSNMCESRYESEAISSIENDYVIVQTKDVEDGKKHIEERGILSNTNNNPEDVQNLNEKKDSKTPIVCDTILIKEESSKMCGDEKEPKNEIEDKHTVTSIENEYVIIQTREDDANLEEKNFLPSPGSLNSSSNNQDFQECSNVTEYLELNLGENKDETYKFTFKINQETLNETSYPSLSPLSNKSENELKVRLSMKDDY